MTSPPVYSTALQQALSLLPHISPTEMKVLISAAKAQWAPRFSNEILADSFRFISRKTLTEKICPVNSRYFQICVNSVPNVHNISMIGVDSSNKKDPTLFLSIPYAYCSDPEKGRYIESVHTVALDDFPHSAPFLRFDVVYIRTHCSRICEFFRNHRESFSQCQSLKMEHSCFESRYVLAESDVQMCGLLTDVFKNCQNVKISSHDYIGRPYYGDPNNYDIFQDDEKLSAEGKILRNKWIGNMVAYLAHYLFNTPYAYLKVDIPQERLAGMLVEKVEEVFKHMTMESEFCVSFIYRPNKLSLSDDETIVTKNEAIQQRLLFYKCSYLNERLGWKNRDRSHPPLEEFRLWCSKIKPDEALSSANGNPTYQVDECASLYTEYYDDWDR
ncbi:hypothetical protein Ddc_14269 [Ditylenchus destructor]|nr:hypothetical protein Ddc_14269 [Ditylenchus destructor]